MGGLKVARPSFKDLERTQGFFMLLDQYYQQNTKLIDLCDNASYVKKTADGTMSADGTNYKVNNTNSTGAVKMLEDDNTASDLGIYHDIELDLTKFSDGSTSSTDDYIYIVLYISDVTKINTSSYGIQVIFDQAAMAPQTNCIYYNIKTGLVTGYNYIKIAKSSFIAVGSGAWDGISSLQLTWKSTADAQNAYVTFNIIQLIRKDPLSSAPNPFQRCINGTWTRDFAITNSEWYVGLENNVITCKMIKLVSQGGAGSASALLGTAGYYDFILYYRTKSTDSSNVYGCNWEIDANNKLSVVIASDELYLQEVVNGSATSYTATFNETINDIIEFKLIKSGSAVKLLAYKNGDYNNPVSISITTTLNGMGYLGIRSDSGVNTNIDALSITESEHCNHSSFSDISAEVENKWKAWTPTVTWGTATPEGNVAQTARYTTIGNICYFNYSYTADDGNDASSLTITLPVTAKDNNAKIALSALQKVNATWTDLMGYIDDDSGGIAFYNFQTCTNAQAVEIIVTGFYEI